MWMLGQTHRYSVTKAKAATRIAKENPPAFQLETKLRSAIRTWRPELAFIGICTSIVSPEHGSSLVQIGCVSRRHSCETPTCGGLRSSTGPRSPGNPLTCLIVLYLSIKSIIQTSVTGCKSNYLRYTGKWLKHITPGTSIPGPFSCIMTVT